MQVHHSPSVMHIFTEDAQMTSTHLETLYLNCTCRVHHSPSFLSAMCGGDEGCLTRVSSLMSWLEKEFQCIRTQDNKEFAKPFSAAVGAANRL